MTDRIVDWSVARAGAITGIVLAIGIMACAPPRATTAPVAVVSPTAASAGQAEKRIRVSVAGALGQAGQYLAQSQGYFAQEGLSVDLVQGDPSNAFTALLAGELDVSGIPVDPGLFNAIQRGVDFRIVATQASSKQDANGVFFVVRAI
jgi:ABC-type nitrate/sulfonate/bicarbonate transport system substrate-binding protein